MKMINKSGLIKSAAISQIMVLVFEGMEVIQW